MSKAIDFLCCRLAAGHIFCLPVPPPPTSRNRYAFSGRFLNVVGSVRIRTGDSWVADRTELQAEPKFKTEPRALNPKKAPNSGTEPNLFNRKIYIEVTEAQ